LGIFIFGKFWAVVHVRVRVLMRDGRDKLEVFV